MPTIRCRTFRWEPLMFFSNSPSSGWDTSSENFLFLKCSCGSCAAPLPDGHFKTKKFSQQKKVVPLHHFSKTFFPHHLQNGSAQARARVTKNTNSNPNVGIHVVCIHHVVVEMWTTQGHDLNSSFNMKSIIRHCCSAERIFWSTVQLHWRCFDAFDDRYDT